MEDIELFSLQQKENLITQKIQSLIFQKKIDESILAVPPLSIFFSVVEILVLLIMHKTSMHC